MRPSVPPMDAVIASRLRSASNAAACGPSGSSRDNFVAAGIAPSNVTRAPTIPAPCIVPSHEPAGPPDMPP